MEGNLTDGVGTHSPLDEKPSDAVLEKAAILAAQRLPVPGNVVDYLVDRVRELEAHNKDLFGQILNLQMQAKIHACEADTQTATVREIYQICTGRTGEPGDWNGAKPVLTALKGARNKALDEAVLVAASRSLDYSVGHSSVPIDDNTARDIAQAIRALKDKGE